MASRPARTRGAAAQAARASGSDAIRSRIRSSCPTSRRLRGANSQPTPFGACHYYDNKARAEIIWLPDEIEEFCNTAYDELSRAVRLEEALGLRIGGLVRLARPHIITTPEGRRAVYMKTSKSGRQRQVQIPLTREAELIVDSPPPGQLLILKPPPGPRTTFRRRSTIIS